MKENEPKPEIEERTFGRHVLRVARSSVVFAITMATLTAALIIIKETEPSDSKEKYKIVIKTPPPKDGEPQLPVFEFRRQCIDRLEIAFPSIFMKAVYKDCE